MKMERRNRKGFTLIELMIVIAIIAILAAILVPNFMKARAQGQLTSCKSNVKNIGTACELYSTDNNGQYPDAITALQGGTSGDYMKTIPVCPASGTKTQKSGDPGDYTYVVNGNFSYYGVYCSKADHTKAAGVTATGFPQFDSVVGLMCPTANQESSDIAANNPG